MTPTLYARIVSDQAQEQFAALSGDRNPMHMDVVAARRTQAGQPVVHGVHTLLWALETAAANGYLTTAPCRLRAKFLKWVYLGDTAELTLSPGTPPTQLAVFVKGMEVLTVDLTFGIPVPPPAPSSPAGAALVDSRDQPLDAALDLNFAALKGHKGEAYTAPSPDVAAAFPALTKLLGARAVAEIAACSYLVGMEAPGLHSMLSKLDLTIYSAIATDARFRKALHYDVSYLDERFRKGRVTVAGSAVAGSLDVFVRVPPVLQAGMDLVSRHVHAGEFAGMNALIIGGSRGLGELTAKLIAAGGGTVNLTYALGKDEAEDVAEQIRATGAHAHALPYDVRKDPDAQLAGLSTVPTHLFYFATSVIFKLRLAVLSPQAFADFTQFYVRGFYDLCTALASSLTATTPARDLRVFYPSTVFIESRPAGMTEYAMAKAAGEQLCVDMNAYLPGVHILSHRLPKLTTDQTAGVLPERENDSIDALLPQIRRVKDFTAIKK